MTGSERGGGALSSEFFAIEVKNLTVRYENGPVLLENISFSVQPGECIAIQGASGSGKSTLLHCICGLIPRSISAERTGTVRLFGQPVEDYPRHELARSIGIVFQNPETQLFCDTVEDELAFGMENICLAKEEMSERIEECLKLTGLEQYRFTSPKHLSGGQKQLVALAAVLTLQPSILLFDEAFSQLDEIGRAQLMGHVEMLRNSGRTIVLVDHDQENLSLAQTLVHLRSKGDGQ